MTYLGGERAVPHSNVMLTCTVIAGNRPNRCAGC
jgi:hypothetical protein